MRWASGWRPSPQSGRLTAGAAIAGYRQDRQEAASATLAPGIVIIGGWRTETTFLFPAPPEPTCDYHPLQPNSKRP